MSDSSSITFGTVYAYLNPSGGSSWIVEQDNGSFFTRTIFAGPDAQFDATDLATRIAAATGTSVSYTAGETLPFNVLPPNH